MKGSSYEDGIPCQFELRWEGQCMEASENGWCDTHIQMRCTRCGKKAVRECNFSDMTLKSFSCNMPLCDECEHEPYVPGKILFPSHTTHLSKREFDQLKKHALNINDDFMETG